MRSMRFSRSDSGAVIIALLVALVFLAGGRQSRAAFESGSTCGAVFSNSTTCRGAFTTSVTATTILLPPRGILV